MPIQFINAMIERVAIKDPKITKHFHIKRELPSSL